MFNRDVEYKQSMVMKPNGSIARSKHRNSSSASLPRSDPVVRCLIETAAEFQGYLPLHDVLTPQMVLYKEGQQFKAHLDWLEDTSGVVWNHEASIFAILDASCEDCGTSFPELHVDWPLGDERWCRYFECGRDALTFKAVPGTALYWRNVHGNKTGDLRVSHAGLPVKAGSKVGINIWMRPRM